MSDPDDPTLEQLLMIERLFGGLPWRQLDEDVEAAIGIIAEPDLCRPGEVAATDDLLDALGAASAADAEVLIRGRYARIHAWRYGPGPSGRQVGDVDFRPSR